MKSTYTAPVAKAHEMKGPNIDQKRAEISAIAHIDVVKMVHGSDENSSSQDLESNSISFDQSQLLGQLPMECCTIDEMKFCRWVYVTRLCVACPQALP